MKTKTQKFRVLKPVVSEWIETTGNIEDEIQNHHANAQENFAHSDGSTYRIFIDEKTSLVGMNEIMSLRLYETGEEEKLISTIFLTGIFRTGGFKDDVKKNKYIDNVCKELGTTRELLFSTRGEDYLQ
jgi:hypothetical protein